MPVVVVPCARVTLSGTLHVEAQTIAEAEGFLWRTMGALANEREIGRGEDAR